MICCLVAINCSGQHGDDIIVESPIIYTTEDGLPSNRVRNIVESDEGFLWITTGGGLCRFDGLDFDTYLHDPEDSSSILDNVTHSLLLDSTSLYVGSHLGFSIMDVETEKFRNFQFSNFKLCDTLDKRVITRVYCIEKGGHGDIWFGTAADGVFRYNKVEGTFRNYRFPISKMGEVYPFNLNIDHILSIKKDRFDSSIIWAGTTAGLIKINSVTDSVEWFLNPLKDKDKYSSQNAVRKIYQHTNGLIYYPTWHAGVIIFDPKSGQFRSLDDKNASITTKEKLAEFLRLTPSLIVQKNEDEIWIRSRAGLMTYNATAEKVVDFRWNEFKNNKIYSIQIFDHLGRAWGDSALGLILFDNAQQQIIDYNFRDLSESSEFSFNVFNDPQSGRIGVLPSASTNIYFLDLDNNEWEAIPIPKRYHRFKNTFAAREISLSPQGEWTISSFSGVISYNPISRKFGEIKVPAKVNTMKYTSVKWDKKGRLWLGTQSEGLIRWTPDNNEWKIYTSELRNPETKVLSLNISNLFEDPEGNIWFRHNQGYSVYDAKKDTIYNHNLYLKKDDKQRWIKKFIMDGQNRIIVNGLFGDIGIASAMHPELGITKHHTVNDKANHRVIDHLEVDSKGTLWGIEFGNVVKIDPNNFKEEIFNLKNELDSDLRIYDLLIGPDDKLIFGGVNRVWIADPEKFSTNTEFPIPYIKRIQVLQKDYETEKAHHLIDHLELDYEENFFSFDFSSIGFTRSEGIRLKYRLAGFKEDWTEAHQRKYANYTNVPSGDYTFELMVSNSEGIWSDDVASIQVSVATPWWLSLWFWFLVALLVALLAYVAYNWRIRQVRNEERLKSDYQKKLTEMEMSALRAQMNPHFIFNAMNSIDYYIISNEQEKASDYLNRFSRLIRLILQNSKSTVVPLKDDLEALKLYIEIESMRFDDLFDYELLVGEKVDIEQIEVPPMIFQPYVENAIWHGLKQKEDGKGKIVIKIRRSDGSIITTIEDNGIGREAAQKIKSKSAASRKSFGMKITKNRLDALNKLANTNASVQLFDLYKEDKTGAGTRVEIVIPI